MTGKQSQIFRFLLFMAGAGIIVLAFFLRKGEQELTRIDAFIWTSIGLMYLVFSLPLFFSVIRIADFSGKIPYLPLLWLGILLYITASAAVIALLATVQLLALNTAIIIQATLIFLFCIDIYFACFASSHISSVKAEERGKLQLLGQIKSKTQILLLSADKLPPEYVNAQKILKKAFDDIKYLSPLNSGIGGDLEPQIMHSLGILAEICNTISAGGYNAALEPEAQKLQILVKERMLLRN